MSKHTPGPWHCPKESISVFAHVADAAKRKKIADMSSATPVEEQQANALLIAKSPEMHELLEYAVQQWGSMIDNDEDINGGDAVEWLVDFITDVREVIGDE